MTINFKAPEIKELQPRLLVMGVGGAGGNAINEMIENNLQGVEFIAVNTDAQDLKLSKCKTRIQIGLNLTKGLGAGAKLDIGQAAADESLNEIVNTLQGANMVFIAINSTPCRLFSIISLTAFPPAPPTPITSNRGCNSLISGALKLMK